jgi:hypothetical protein
MKTGIIIVLTLLMLPVALIVWYRRDSGPNRGHEFGYYGEFNRMSNALASIPGVTVTNWWWNRDITLEEFGFSLTVTGRPVSLAFGETDPVREMSRGAAARELTARIKNELSLSKTNN